MGTKGDIYLGSGVNAKWIGSVANDAYPSGEMAWLLHDITTEERFLEVVNMHLASRDDATLPEQGWPWPWNDSRGTDYTYCFVKDHVEIYCFGRLESLLKSDDSENAVNAATRFIQIPKSEFPDMSNIQRVTFGKRSGLLII